MGEAGILGEGGPQRPEIFTARKTTHNPGERLALALAPEIAVTLDVLAG